MKRSHYFIMMLILLTIASCRNKDTETETLDAYVVMVSFDGFRWDFAESGDTPNLDDMATKGVKAERMIPSFPTSTFPNHYSLATGLYPDHHGIINNSFYSAELNGVYRIGDESMVTNPAAYFGEPIWVTAEKQGIKAASHFWVGSEAPIMETSPSYWEIYDGSIPYLERVDQVIEWLKLPVQKRPGLVLLYFDEPDHTAHRVGPEHSSIGRLAAYLDSVLGYLRDEIADLDYGDRVNLIVLSDHGMGSVSNSKYVNLLDYIQEDWTTSMIGGNPLYLIDPVEQYKDSITLALSDVEGLNAWQKEDIPERLQYGNSPRFPGIMILADSTWSIGKYSDPSGYTGGAHGYDNAFTKMHSIFFAEGPAFKSGYTAPAFPNVDVYSIITHILGLDPAPTDGDMDRVSGMFATE